MLGRRELRGPATSSSVAGARRAQGIGLFGGIFLAATAVGVVGQGYRAAWPARRSTSPSGLASRSSVSRCCDRMRASLTPASPRCCERSTGRCAGSDRDALVVAAAWIDDARRLRRRGGRRARAADGLGAGVCIAVTVATLLMYSMPGGMRAVTATNFAHLAIARGVDRSVVVLAAGHASAVAPGSARCDLVGLPDRICCSSRRRRRSSLPM